MRDALDALAAALHRPGAPSPVEDHEVDEAASRAIVVLPAGGFGFRMRSATSDEGVTQKALLPLPNGETLIGRLVREYAEAGVRRFLALVNYEGRAVEAHLDGGRPWGVEIACSYDPEPTGSGRTGAMVAAMEQGLLPEGGPVVVHNADCHLIRYPGSFPRDLLRAHLAAVRDQGAVATIAAVDGTPYPYTGMRVEDGRVTGIEMYPFIPVPTHTGITALTAEALASLRQNATRGKQNFERDMFPRWSAEGRLGAFVFPHQHWIAVDDRKALRLFSKAVEEEGASSSNG